MKVTVIPIVIGAFGTVTNPLVTVPTGRIGNNNISGDHPNNSIVKISQNTEKRPGDLVSLKPQ